MRPTCLYCASKHVAQAIVLMLEAAQGYPLHRWLAVGHLAEAGDETVAAYPELAAHIREQRLALMNQSYDGKFDLFALLKEVRSVAVSSGQEPDEVFIARLYGRGQSNG
jgi:hypothetical protein